MEHNYVGSFLIAHVIYFKGRTHFLQYFKPLIVTFGLQHIVPSHPTHAFMKKIYERNTAMETTHLFGNLFLTLERLSMFTDIMKHHQQHWIISVNKNDKNKFQDCFCKLSWIILW